MDSLQMEKRMLSLERKVDILAIEIMQEQKANFDLFNLQKQTAQTAYEIMKERGILK